MFIVLACISIFSVLIPLSLAILQWKKIPYDIKVLRWLLIAGLSDVAGGVLSFFSINNLWLGDVFMFIQFTILLYIFSHQFENRIMFKAVYGGIVIFYLVSLLFLNSAIVSLVRSNAVDGLVLIIVSIVFFYKLLNELKVLNIHRLPILWISFATLFYYSGNLFVFLASNYLTNQKEYFLLTWMLHNFLNVTKNILFAVALWQNYRTVKSLA